MALARPPANSGSFGRRTTEPGRQAASAPSRKPTVSPRPEARTADAVSHAIDAVASDVNTAASRGKAYVSACLSGAAAFLAVLFVLTGVENRFFQAGPMLVFLAIPVVPTLALVLYLPTVVLSDVARLLSIPRGWADLGIGFVLGFGLGVAFAVTRSEPHAVQTAIGLTAGGLVGGWAFWRAQGYPGLSSGQAAAVDVAYRKLR